MFEELIKQVSALNGQRIAIRIPLDEKGYFDRQCSNNECKKYFKVNFEDWKNIVKDEVVYCPICKYESPATEWNTESQQEYIKDQGLSVIQDHISESLKKDARNFNSKQKKGFINISLSYKQGSKIIPIAPEVFKELEQNYGCLYCGCHYSYFGTAYFCPSCGEENTEGNIKEWTRNIQLFVKESNKIKKSYKGIFSEEESESAFSQFTEDQFCRIVSIFQKHSENLFERYPGSEAITIRKNLFQNLIESSIKWKELTGQGYEEIFELRKYKEFKKYFQIRHVLSHTGGIVDADFITKTNASYKEGQRVLIDIGMLDSFINIAIEFMAIMKAKYKK